MKDNCAPPQPSRFSPSDARQQDNTNTNATADNVTQNNNLSTRSIEDMRALTDIYHGLRDDDSFRPPSANIDLKNNMIEFGVTSIEKDLNAAAINNGAGPKDTNNREPRRTGREAIQDLLDTYQPGPDADWQFDPEGARRYQRLHIPPPLGLPPLPQRTQ